MRRGFLAALIVILTTSLSPLSAQSDVSKLKTDGVFKAVYEAPFALSVAPDVAILTASAASFVTGFILSKHGSFPEWYERSYNKNSINSFDKLWYNKYNSNIDHAADVTVGLVGYALPIIVFAGEGFAGNLVGSDLLTIGVMFAESALLTNGVKNIVKTNIRRTRPYMYTDKWDSDGVKKGDFVLSFPSGHSSDAFMGAAFLTYVFSEYFPESKLKWPLIVGSYALAFSTSALRVASGNHFITDTLAGAALGTAIGLGIPFIHSRIAAVKFHDRSVLSFTGNTLNARLFF